MISTQTFEELPGLEALGPCELEFEYRHGSSDYFADGCGYPGDAPEVELVRLYPEDPALGAEFTPLGPLTGWLLDHLDLPDDESDYDDPRDWR